MPTTPNPTGGYFVMLKKSDCVVLDMSVDEALTYVISMGVIVPGGPKHSHQVTRPRRTSGVFRKQ